MCSNSSPYWKAYISFKISNSITNCVHNWFSKLSEIFAVIWYSKLWKDFLLNFMTGWMMVVTRQYSLWLFSWVSEKSNNNLEKWYRKGMPFLIVQIANYPGWSFVQSVTLHRNFWKQLEVLEYWAPEPWKQRVANGSIQRNCHFSLVLFVSHCFSSVLPVSFFLQANML